jgi:hypothetical protein
MTAHFKQIVVLDFEFETKDGDYGLVAGDLPAPLCLAAHVLDEHLRRVRVIHLWRGEFGSAPPFDIGDDTLVAGYSVWAELTCFMALNWAFPKHVFDLHTAYLAASNVLLPYEPDEARKRPRKRLPDACRAYGVAGWESIDKEAIAKDIGEGRWRIYGREVVLAYCEEDVRMSVLLLKRQLRGGVALPPASVEHVLRWSDYRAKSVTLIQAKGMPIDVPLWNLVQENKAAVIRSLLRRFDPSHGSVSPIYTDDGEWSYERFERWLVSANIAAWPRLESGRLNVDGDTFRLMWNREPACVTRQSQHCRASQAADWP